ncbi:hypothetical protein MEBOL_005657 [Melittangium boletus DSM 14713]|uniref:JAB domain-containing protein n=1 Tax=Melittangium boletus DSM 14713 TaxID=1294270 RepID=A0A250ILW9_9BACT|nr:hypothetical protein MEBOL_005657 [Melittangium boletus DSM 14713]
MKRWELLLVFCLGCAGPSSSSRARVVEIPKGPWAEVPAVESSTDDTSIPIGLIRDMADALLKRPGARVCDPVTHLPIVGLSTEYCSTVYVAGSQDSLSWRVTEPVMGSHGSCKPFSRVEDDDYPASQVWVVGYIHNHPCGSPPSSGDLGTWPTDAFNPYVAMAEVRLIPGNPIPAVHGNVAVEIASAVVAERPDGTRIFLRYFPTGEIQQWSDARARWVALGQCSPRERGSRFKTPRCENEPLRLLSE